MLFTLKKIIGGLLLPLPLSLIILGIGLLLLWCSHRQRLAKILLTGGWGLLLLLSLQPVADGLLTPFENQYPTLNHPPRVAAIVVLGGGYTYNPEWAPSSNLLGNSLPRVAEGVRQWRMNPTAELIFTGAAASDNSRSSASVAAEVAQTLGVPKDKLITLTSPRDTHQEALAVRQLIGNKPFILVTSANHLPRAIRFFTAEQLSPIPAPANQLAIHSPLNFWERILPSSFWLGHSERAWYESLGRAWQWVTQR
ncbi:envelope biogenesis factor ElyC [Rosenbergiella australiborealis]|uniref:Envelope biogenesis factor ElyC n=1 Tax=Rosenbergiella australiborealis TaxID=1544696 RepID=A0ABS5T3L9_9GAMM|nr:envelope biogenesis factor ElyC [Rosenbergiella australiborealis]MBT0726949.1 envelope biogenesis factor ElyC [Rosenbergiella australiborealis]